MATGLPQLVEPLSNKDLTAALEILEPLAASTEKANAARETRRGRLSKRRWAFSFRALRHRRCRSAPRCSQSIGLNLSFEEPQTGHTQSAGRSSNAVPGSMPALGSPSAGS